MTIDNFTRDLLEGIGPCLDELEQEYLKAGSDHCKGLEDHSQLSAFLMVGIRSICLLRGMLRLSDPQSSMGAGIPAVVWDRHRGRDGADHGEHGLSPPYLRNRQCEMVTKIGAGFRVAERRLWWAGRNSDPVG